MSRKAVLLALALLAIGVVIASATWLAPRNAVPASEKAPALPPRLAIAGDSTRGLDIANGLRDPVLVDVTTSRADGTGDHPHFVACLWRESPLPVRPGQQTHLEPGKCTARPGDATGAIEVRVVNAATGEDLETLRLP
ncbi:MAG: hypothetical protein JSR18_02980 [Proteobacteria bacterium]|nr:hypothetical protein [Pseudomonadota bacterium]